MQEPLEITFRDVLRTDALERLIAQESEKLEKVSDHITSVTVAVEKPQAHQRFGNPFRVRVEVLVPPGHRLVSKREPGEGDMHEPLEKVIRDAFEAVRKRLRKLMDLQKGRTKQHPEQQLQGVVSKIFPGEGYGFLQALEDGREIYFHRNSVIHDNFGRLEVGTGVRFSEEAGDSGPQASTVWIVDKPGPRLRTPAH